MSESEDKAVFKLRQDVHLTIQEEGENDYILEDPLRQKYFRIGSAEYLFLAQLDGYTSLEEAVAKTNKLLQTETYDLQSGGVVIKWLQQNQLLAESSGQEGVAARVAAEQSADRQKLAAKLNLITIKLPLFNPDRLLQVVSPWLSWLTGPVVGCLWLVMLLYGGAVLGEHWVQFSVSASAALTASNIFFLWAAWFFLKILHETFHALTCYRYQGRVYEAGILFIVFFPLTYINASSSWGFASRWQRIHVAVAGIYVELFVAAIALIIWSENIGTAIGSMAHNIVLVAGFSSLVFNANPLLRFDGYFILTDIVGIPNLYNRGRDFVNSSFSYAFFREWTYLRRFSIPKEIFIGCYGVASWIWRILVVVVLVSLVSSMFQGFGIFIGLVALALMLGPPILRLKRRLLDLSKMKPETLRYFTFSSLSIVLGLFCLLYFTAWQKDITVPAVVKYRDETLVRAEVNGFVDTLYVEAGQKVEKGTPMLFMTNPELLEQRQQLQLQLEKLQYQKRNMLIGEDLASYQVLEEQVTVVAKKLEAVSHDVAKLTIVAPAPGTILGRKLDQKIGTYLTKGEPIFEIVSEQSKKLLAAVEQDEIVAFRQLQSGLVQVRQYIMGKEPFSAKIIHVSPSADTRVPDNALSAVYGGPIAVHQATAAGGFATEGESYQFFTPRFEVEIDVPGEFADSMLAGQLAVIHLKGEPVNLLYTIKNWMTMYFSKRLSGNPSNQ